MRYLCYPYMRESASTVDFEIRTDSLTTRIGQAASVVQKHQQLHILYEDLMELIPMTYHLNGSVRGERAIEQSDLEHLSGKYDFYVSFVEEKIQQFLLPQGSDAACALHVCRSEAKKSVRALHKVSLEREVDKILFDYTHLLANVFFVMAVYANQQLEVEEITFESKSYKPRVKKERTR